MACEPTRNWRTSILNGAMLRAGPIDELSVLITPVVDGRIDTPALFDIDGSGGAPLGLRLEAVERRPGDVLWLRYLAAST